MQLIKVKQHFRLRASRYESSARWVRDRRLLNLIKEKAAVGCRDYVLDIASGTGLIGALFFKQVRKVIGVDLTEEMFIHAKQRLDYIVCSQAEYLPFKDNIFDLVICRQGLQFMDVFSAVSQMYRVCRPQGKIMLIQLVAFGREDRDYAFKIQMARQPARLSCFLEEDLIDFLKKVNCQDIQTHAYFTYESVNEWIDNGALSPETQLKIKKLYYEAPQSFRCIHEIEFRGDDIIDKMKIAIVWGYKDAKNNK